MSSLSYDNLLRLLTTIRDESGVHANTAFRVGTALIELLQYLNDAPYLRKDQADQTNYLLQLIAGAVIGESGQIRLNADGSISCSRSLMSPTRYISSCSASSDSCFQAASR